MIKYKHFLIGLSIGFLFSSCGASKKRSNTTTTKKLSKIEKKSKAKEKLNESKSEKVTIVTPSKKNLNTLDYIEEYAHIAVAQMQEHRIPASITLAQGILESNSGNSRLTQNSNNHFGIKCHKGWTGLRTYYDDDEKGECFRVYQDPAKSYNDHALFLTKRNRYEGLFKLNERDYKAWAKGLQKAGYATDKKYPQKLIRIIDKYELYKYDEKVLGKGITNENVIVSNDKDKNASVYIVKKGDGLYGISRKYGLNVEELRSINNLDSNTIYPGQKLYLKPIKTQIVQEYKKPKDTASVTNEISAKVNDTIPPVKEIVSVVTTSIDTIPPKKEIDVQETVKSEAIKPKEQIFHIVKKGETLYQIAYKYELEIPDIRRWNGIKKDEITIGQRLFINEPDSSKSIEVEKKTHTVARGETLFSLARKNGMTVSELRELNNLQNVDIKIGQVLLIK